MTTLDTFFAEKKANICLEYEGIQKQSFYRVASTIMKPFAYAKRHI